MADDNLYDVTLRDGRRFEVTTPHHHDDHDDATWRRHLVDILKNTVAGLASAAIAAYVFRGRAPRR
jgi:hypothetical protein